MNLIEKVVIKDGVNADTTVTINLYTGQVAEINALLVHPNIPNTRGVAAYAIVGGQPRASFSAVGDNEMWLYVGGIGIKVNGVTTLAPDTAIKILANTGSATYVYSAADNGKVLIVNDASGFTTINALTFPDGDSFILINNKSTGSITVNRTANITTVAPKSVYNFYKIGSTNYTNIISALNEAYKNIGYVSTQHTNIVDSESKYPVLEYAYVGAKSATFPVDYPSGKEIILANIADGDLTVVLPVGTTTIDGFSSIVIPHKFNAKMFYSSNSSFWYISLTSISLPGTLVITGENRPQFFGDDLITARSIGSIYINIDTFGLYRWQSEDFGTTMLDPEIDANVRFWEFLGVMH